MNTVKLKTGGGEVEAVLLKPVVVDILNYKETVIKDGHIKLSDILNKK